MNGRTGSPASPGLLLWVVALLLLSFPVNAEQNRISVNLGTTEVRLGEPVSLQIEVPAAVSRELLESFPPSDPDPAIRLVGEWRLDDEAEETSRLWNGHATFYQLGDVTFPSLSLTVEGMQPSASIPVLVLGRLDEETAGNPEALADLKGPASLKPNLRPWLYALAGLIGLLVLGWYARRAMKKVTEKLRAEPIVTDPFDRLSPHEWAYGELKALLGSRWAEEGEYDRFYTRLSWILRRYLGGRFRIELMERTTTEMLPLLHQAGASGDWIETLMPLFSELDRVKYAAGTADPDRCRESVEESYRLIDASRPQPTKPADGEQVEVKS
jgi:hypothetical protein